MISFGLRSPMGPGFGPYLTLSARALAVEFGNQSDVAVLKRLWGVSGWLLFLPGRLLASLSVSKCQIQRARSIRNFDASLYP